MSVAVPPDIVEKIKEAYETTSLSPNEISRQFGLSREYVRVKAARNGWKRTKPVKPVLRSGSVPKRQVKRWTREYVSEAELAKSEAEANTAVERALYALACGYSTTETKAVYTRGKWETIEIVKNHRPSYRAIYLWLSMRSPDRWRMPKNDTPINIAASGDVKIQVNFVASDDNDN